MRNAGPKPDGTSMMLDSIDAPVIQVDENYELLAVNATARQLLGIPPNTEFLSDPLTHLGEHVDAKWVTRVEDLILGVTQHAVYRDPGSFTVQAGTACGLGATVRALPDGSQILTLKYDESCCVSVQGSSEIPASIMQRVLETVDCGILLLDPDLNVALANDQFFAIRKAPRPPEGTVLSYADLIRSNSDRLLFQPDGDPEDALETYLKIRIEQVREGNYSPEERCSATGQTVVHSCVNIGGWRLLSYYDLTDLRAREQNFASVLANIDYGVIFADADLKSEIINDKFFEIWNTDPADLPANPSLTELMQHIWKNGGYAFGSDDEAAWTEFHDRAIQRVREGNTSNVELSFPNGQVVLYSCYAVGSRRLLTYYDITEIRQRDEDSRLLKEAIELNPMPFCVYDKEDRLLAWNKSYEAAHKNGFAKYREKAENRQLTYRELSAEDIPDIVPQTEADVFIDNLVDTHRNPTGSHVDREYRDGHWLRIMKYKMPSGGSAGMAIDISELKEREAELKDTTLLLNEVVACMEPGLIVQHEGPSGEPVISISNPQAAKMLELPEELLRPATPLRNMIEHCARRGDFGEDSGDTVERICSNATDQDAEETPIYLRLTPNGRYIRSKGIFRPNGLCVVTYTDITETKEREKELERSNKLLDEILAEMDQGLIVHGKDFDGVPVIRHSNSMAEDLLDLPEGMLRPGSDYLKYLNFCTDRGDFGDESTEMVAHCLNIYDHPTGSESFYRTTPSGRHILAKARSRGTGGWIATYTDVSDLKVREAELEDARLEAEEASRAKSEFLANMSHEIRTPMNGVLGMAELLKTTGLDGRQKSYVDVIASSGNMLLAIINDILDFSKISANQLTLESVPFDLETAVQDVISLVRPTIDDKELEILVRFAPDLPTRLVGDVHRFRQIIMNLTGNAVKFTEQGHVLVEVAGECSEDETYHLSVSVSDTGVGIPEDMTETIFDKFSQADSGKKTTAQGTGLGLAIARSIAEAMGGGLTCTSEVGVGSTFTATLKCPIAEDSQQRQRRKLDRSGLRILIVDDNEMNRKILSEQLDSWGFASETVSSGSQALSALAMAAQNETPFEAVVLDYKMDEMDGLTVADRIRACEVTEDLPILLLTSVDTLDQQVLHDHKIQALLVKPVKSSVLLDGVLDAVDSVRTGVPAINRSSPSEVQVDDTENEPSFFDHDLETQPLILVAEDNAVNRMVIGKMLEPCGCRVIIAENGDEAVELYNVHQPDLILMDVSMPITDGLEATRRIRAQEVNETRHLPIIAVTAHALPTDELKCRNAGMDDYLTKPLDQTVLLETVQSWLAKTDSEGTSTETNTRRSAF